MRRLLTLPLTAALGAGLLVGVVASAAPASAAIAPGARFVGVDPVRLVDTRDGVGALGPGGTLTLDLRDRVPITASAVVLDLTADAPTQAGYLTVYAADGAQPATSNLNKRAGETRSNSVTATLPADGSRRLVIVNQAGSTQVVVDLFGFYDLSAVGTGTGTSYYSYPGPIRVTDTRQNGQRLQPGGAYTVDAVPPAGVSGVTGVAVNLTAVAPSGPGFLTAWNGISTRPTVSSVNFGRDPATPNFAIVPAYEDTRGVIHFTVVAGVSAVDLVVDYLGVYGRPGAVNGSYYLALTPRRTSDTRTLAYRPFPNSSVICTVDGRLGRSTAVNLTITAVDPTTATYLTAYPGPGGPPLASTVNAVPGQVVANAAQVSDSNGGSPLVYNQAGRVDILCDYEGYFRAEGSEPG